MSESLSASHQSVGLGLSHLRVGNDSSTNRGRATLAVGQTSTRNRRQSLVVSTSISVDTIQLSRPRRLVSARYSQICRHLGQLLVMLRQLQA